MLVAAFLFLLSLLNIRYSTTVMPFCSTQIFLSCRTFTRIFCFPGRCLPSTAAFPALKGAKVSVRRLTGLHAVRDTSLLPLGRFSLTNRQWRSNISHICRLPLRLQRQKARHECLTVRGVALSLQTWARGRLKSSPICRNFPILVDIRRTLNLNTCSHYKVVR